MTVADLIKELEKYPSDTEVAIDISGMAFAYDSNEDFRESYSYEADATDLRFVYNEPATKSGHGHLLIENEMDVDIDLEN